MENLKDLQNLQNKIDAALAAIEKEYDILEEWLIGEEGEVRISVCTLENLRDRLGSIAFNLE